MRRAFNLLKMGRPGPVMVEIPADVAIAEVADQVALQYKPVKATSPSGNAHDIEAATRVLLEAKKPVIHAGQGVLYAEACPELTELAELLQIPVMTTLEGKSAFPEDHPVALGTGGGGVMSGPSHHFLSQADVVLGVGCSFTKHGMATNIPAGKIIIHATNDERDLNKNYPTDHPILGDAKLVLRQLIDAIRDALEGHQRASTVPDEIQQIRTAWLAEWTPKLTSHETPISPYRVIWDF